MTGQRDELEALRDVRKAMDVFAEAHLDVMREMVKSLGPIVRS